jgi:hypothetical protein
MDESSGGSPGGFNDPFFSVPRPAVATGAVRQANTNSVTAIETFAQARPEVWQSPAALSFLDRLEEVRALVTTQAEMLEKAAREAAIHGQAVAETPLVGGLQLGERGEL